jgi:hypothetical protein
VIFTLFAAAACAGDNFIANAQQYGQVFPCIAEACNFNEVKISKMAMIPFYWLTFHL